MSGGPLRAAATPPRDRASAVLHLTSAAGGGVDRYIRDVAAHSARPQLIWHVGSQVDIIEHPRGRFLPLSRPGDDASGAALARWLREAGAGLVHLHGVSAECRSRLAALPLGNRWWIRNRYRGARPNRMMGLRASRYEKRFQREAAR